jgi:hypothetical protein
MSAEHDVVPAVTTQVTSKLNVDATPIWTIFWFLRNARSNWADKEISNAAQAVLERLVAGGAAVGDLARPPLGIRPWPDQTSVVSKVAQAWRVLGRDPAPGEIGALEAPFGPPSEKATDMTALVTMDDTPSDADDLVTATVKRLARELREDIVGPWEIFWILRRSREDWSQDEISRTAEEVLRRLMTQSLAVFGDPAPFADDFVPWPDQRDAVQRVVNAWQSLGRDPGPSEVGWVGWADPNRYMSIENTFAPPG